MTSRVASYLNRLRNRHFFFLDLLILLITPFLAILLRTDYLIAVNTYLPDLLVYMAYAIPLRLAIFYGFGLYQRFWRYASIDELAQLALANLASTLVVVAVFYGLRLPALGICPAWPEACGLPRSLPLLDGILAFLFVSGLRFAVRFADLWRRSRGTHPGAMKRVLVVGAGDAGAMIAKELRSNPRLGLEPIGFVDDDMHKYDVRIHGLPVLGNRDRIPAIVREHAVQQVIIAMPTAPGKVIREMLAICERAGVRARTMPGIYELLDETVHVSQLRDVQIEDLLRREPIQTDTAAVQALLRGKRVLITGGGGSIGSELCRQVWRCRPAQLIVVGHGENSIFEIVNELLALPVTVRQNSDPAAIVAGERVEAVIADIRFAERMDAVMQHYRPQVVFHAAAHKHVPLMEQNPGEAITNNVMGTRNVLEAAHAAQVEHFVMISTDKAVNPTSIMGASKRAAELLVHRMAEESGKPYVAVRFGNVLGSRGSVVLTFQKQIAAGGPVTVTHPDMRRYFMTIPEAVQLVLQAAVLGHGGEVFVLDMGDPVRIVDLAQDLIELSGYEVGRDIDIQFTGMRPGEKLYEELFVAGEHYERTRHNKIFIAANASSIVPADLDATIADLGRAAASNDRSTVLAELQHLIPEFQPPDAEVAQPSEAAHRAGMAALSPENGNDYFATAGQPHRQAH